MWQARPSSVATRNGVIAGVILGLLSLPLMTFSAIGRAVARLDAPSVFFLLVAVIVFLVIGYLATRRTGRLRSGVWSGFLAGLITAFIAVCLGIVILTLLAPYTLTAPRAGVVRRGGRAAVTLLARTVVVRLLLDALTLMIAGALAGLLGGALGRIGRPHAESGSGARPAPSPPAPEPRGYTPASAQPYADAYPTPQMGATPQPYYPIATPYDDSAPTTFHQSQD
ncbi:MAG: hypothetical protein ACRDID_18645 [Ktedonobacterales bacterium]